MKVYITHCSAKKDFSLKGTNIRVPPDVLYTSDRIQGFMKKCKEQKVEWAIFSDNYGVWFPDEKHEWYEKSPYSVTEEEFKQLVKNFDDKLSKYDEIFFYHNPGRFHHLYKRLLNEVKLKDKIVLISKKDVIRRENFQIM